MTPADLHGWSDSLLSAEESAYLTEITHFFLALRGTGFFLSPRDSDILQGWLEAQVPLTTVLRGLHRGARKLQEKHQPVRTLSSLQRYVGQEARRLAPAGSRKRRATPSAQPALADAASPQYDRVLEWITGHEAHLERLFYDAQAQGLAARCGLLQDLLAKLNALRLPASWGPGGPVPALLGLGRQLYQGWLSSLTAEEQAELRAQALGALRGFGGDMSDEARAETLMELELTLVREQLGLFEPGSLFSLWDD